jgi:hypothetical protein
MTLIWTHPRRPGKSLGNTTKASENNTLWAWWQEPFNVCFPATMQQDITHGKDMHEEEEAPDGKDGEGNEEVYYWRRTHLYKPHKQRNKNATLLVADWKRDVGL